MTLHDPRNIILMLDLLEEHFDKWHWTLLPISDDEFQVSCMLTSRLLMLSCICRHLVQ
jgi:hypothetical protein